MKDRLQLKYCSPCKDCTERKRACSDYCKKYKAYKETIKGAKKYIKSFLITPTGNTYKK